MNIINPATNQVIQTVSEDTNETLAQKLATLKHGQTSWQKVLLTDRIACLQRFRDLLEKNKEDLAATLTSETGKPLAQSRNEINGAKHRIQWLCKNADATLRDEWMSEEAGMGEKISYEPLGVVCNISAWNYPYLVGVNVFVPALLAGNAVLYKPSEFATLTGLAIEKLLSESGVPKEVFSAAVGAREVGAALLTMNFDGYFFTGSYATGQYVYEQVATKMVPCQLELGGKDPLYVADDVADVAAVAAGTADGVFYNNGQSCCAVERIYVHEKVYDDYLTAFVKEVKSWKVGAPTEDGVYIGALTRAAQIKVLAHQVKDAIDKGASLLTGGKKIESEGNFFEPTVLINVTNDMAVMQEESFGPIIGIMKVKDDAEAIRFMNDTAYGLTAAVYTSTQERAENILSQINSGTGYWNCCDRVSPGLPWSGRKHSGFGATLSYVGIRAFTKPKAYHLRGDWKK